MKPYYADESVTLQHGDALTVLSSLPDASVNCCVTSPPYFGLRDYGVQGQLGLEASPAEYVENLRALFAQVRRVLADDGTLWLNLGDSYVGRANAGPTRDRHRGHGHKAGITTVQRNMTAHAPYKSMLGMPWRVAFALIDDGWTLRNDIIWHKPNAMPESMKDRLSTRHEHVFMLTKSTHYWFDLNAVQEPGSGRKSGNHERTAREYARATASRFGGNPGSTLHTRSNETRNPGDVWSIPTQPFPGAHFAVMPSALAERCILAGAKPGGVVLDPFSGTGTTGLAAARHGCKYIGVDLNAEYLEMSMRTRLAQPGLDFGNAS